MYDALNHGYKEPELRDVERNDIALVDQRVYGLREKIEEVYFSAWRFCQQAVLSFLLSEVAAWPRLWYNAMII